MADPTSPIVRRALFGTINLLIAVAALLCLSAWSLDYWEGWAFLINFAICSTAITAYLARYDPALLERRLRAGPMAEREPRQKIIMAWASLGFLALLVLPGIDHQFGWSQVPLSLVVAGHVLIVLGFAGFFVVVRENPFSSATVELAEKHRVIDTGPYALVRHPMYAAALLLVVGMPLALGSSWTLLLIPLITPALAARLLDEERFLAEKLPGYDAYRQRVRWRLIPGLW